MIEISACIITFNEADRIQACIQSLGFCDEIIIIDSGSTDGTVALAESLGAKVQYRKFNGFRSQKQFAVEQASHDWVLCMDADEVISPLLRENILRLQRESFQDLVGVCYARCSKYHGRFLRHGVIYPDHVFRLFDRRHAGWHGDREIHEEVIAYGKVAVIDGDLLHTPYRSFAHHYEKMNRYARMMAEHRHENGIRASKTKAILSPLALLLRGLVLRLGFLDGWQGLCFHLVMANYALQKELFLFDLENK